MENLPEYYEIYNPFISDYKFGTYDHASDQILNITLTINFDYAEFKRQQLEGKTIPLGSRGALPVDMPLVRTREVSLEGSGVGITVTTNKK